MLHHSVGSALGFLILSFLTWSVTFAILVFGVMLRRKILLWDDQWKEKLDESGISVQDYADDMTRTYEKIRSTFRLLGFFLLVIVGLMVWVGYLNLGYEKPILGYLQVASSLWLLLLVALSVIAPAFINFAVGTYLSETMMLKANVFVHKEAQEQMREKKAKVQFLEKAKQLKAQREAMKAQKDAAAKTGPGPEVRAENAKAAAK